MSKERKILFIGLSCVGDVIMTTPVMQSLHQSFPDAILDVVADPRSQDLYKNCPYVNTIYIKDKNLFLRGTPALFKQLWSNYYDIVVDVRTDGLAYFLRAGRRFTKRNAVAYGPHAVEKTMGVIASLHGDKPVPDTTVWLSEKHRAYAKDKLSVLPDRQRLLAISTGEPGKPFKNWTTDKWIEFLNRNKDQCNGIVFVGGPNEHEETEKIKKAVDYPSVDVVGNSLLEAAAILEQVWLYIGPDSGLGHLASAVKTGTITLFSNFEPQQYQPWGCRALSIKGDKQDARNITVAGVEDLFNRFVSNNL